MLTPHTNPYKPLNMIYQGGTIKERYDTGAGILNVRVYIYVFYPLEY